MRVYKLSKQRLAFDFCPNIRLKWQKEETRPKCIENCRICFGNGIVYGKTLEYVNARKLCQYNGMEYEFSEMFGCIYCGIVFHKLNMQLTIDDENSLVCGKCRNPTIIASCNPAEFPIEIERVKELQKFWFGF